MKLTLQKNPSKNSPPPKMTITIPLAIAASREAVVASPAKTFSEAYILHLNVNAENAGPNDNINITYCPFDKESGERLLTEQREISVPFWQIMEEVPKAADAFKAVCDALPLLIAHKKKEKDAEEAYHKKLADDGQEAIGEESS
jgi:hypothetical protein